ncbi:MAG: magnesium transporter CorA family protein [Patescibacteria group bacterium]
MANYKKISDRIEELSINNPRTSVDLKWVNIVNVGKNEIAYLRKGYKFDLVHLRATAASVYFQRPQLFKGSDYIFLVLHFPVLQDGRIIAAEVDFFIGHGFLITINNNNLKALTSFFSLGKKSPDSLLSYSLESAAILLYEILDNLIASCYQLIDENSIALNEIEDLIFSNKQTEAVKKILITRRNIVSVRKIMQNHKNILQQLMDMDSRVVEKQAIKKYYNNLVDHSKRIWEMLDNQKEMVEVLNNTNESFSNDRMTRIMKTLTIFSVILMPLNLIAVVFAMRTEDMPLIYHPNSFWIIIGLMSILSLSMLIFFNKKRWLR